MSVPGKSVASGEYGLQVQVKQKGGRAVICLATIRRAPDGMKFWMANFNENQKTKGRYNPQITVDVGDVEELCANLRLAAASIEQGTTIDEGWESAEPYQSERGRPTATPGADMPEF